ncbi:MAG: class I SAM-dependent methyltransferase [Alkalibacterium sp.]|nr:class I SAM-dependent methyltransferase [Alkalibacterium sp.]
MTEYLTNESKRRWNEFADDYAQMTKKYGDLHKEILLTPNLLTLIGEVKDKTVLDAGCGEGYLSRLLAGNGATVTAVDFSERMIELAVERTTEEDIHYGQANLENLSEFTEGQFDAVVSNMVIQDVSNLSAALNELYRVLKIEGCFVFSILHPCFITPESRWEKDEQGEKLYWKVDDYFKEGQFEQRFGTKDRVFAFHRTVSTYINTLIKTGFTLEEVVEPKPSRDQIEKHPDFEEDLRKPDFFVFKVKK